MREFSVLVAGKAGDGVNQAGVLLASLLSELGYRIYMVFDYPSLIRGGHNFSIVRASEGPVAAHRDKIDFLLALNQEGVDFHKDKLTDASHLAYDSDTAEGEGLRIPLTTIMKEENARPIMRNSCLMGTFAKSVGIGWGVLEKVLRGRIAKEVDLNLKVALRGYNEAKELLKLEALKQKVLPVLTGNEAIGLGLISSGLSTYIAYPMTPSSSLLHFLAGVAGDFSLKVIHPENEIAVMLMALGCAYAGEKVAVGTSGGGFCLMTEGLSLAGMAELPVVALVGQRPGPSTGLPTYTGQGELHFVLNAGQGEFPRFVVAPGDGEEAFCWAQVAQSLSWKYQLPSIILSDKTLSEGVYSLDISSLETPHEQGPVVWDEKQPYKRYMDSETGISPLAFPPHKEAIIKVNSYEHDEYGITTEDPSVTRKMQEKRLRKERYLTEELEEYETVKVYGKRDSSQALLCWGSNKGVCVEVGESLGFKVIQPLVLSPFPAKEFEEALKGVKKVVAAEHNATGQLARLVSTFGFNVDHRISKYDGRSLSLEELQREIERLRSLA